MEYFYCIISSVIIHSKFCNRKKIEAYSETQYAPTNPSDVSLPAGASLDRLSGTTCNTAICAA